MNKSTVFNLLGLQVTAYQSGCQTVLKQGQLFYGRAGFGDFMIADEPAPTEPVAPVYFNLTDVKTVFDSTLVLEKPENSQP